MSPYVILVSPPSSVDVDADDVRPPLPPSVEADDVRPPLPPSVPSSPRGPIITDGDFVFSNFEYVHSSSRSLLIDACRVMNRNEMWRPFRCALRERGIGENGFMFNQDPLYNRIKCLITSTPTGDSHSGCSLALIMRTLSQIALLGEDEYRLKYIARTASSALKSEVRA